MSKTDISAPVERAVVSLCTTATEWLRFASCPQVLASCMRIHAHAHAPSDGQPYSGCMPKLPHGARLKSRPGQKGTHTKPV